MIAWTTRPLQRVVARTETAVGRVRRFASAVMTVWGPEGGDAVLYGLATVFALLTGLLGGLAFERDWAWFALGPYAACALVSAWVGRRKNARAAEPRAAHWGPARVWILLFLLVGATLAPLSAEAALIHEGPTTSHVAPEVVVIAQASKRLFDGQHLYAATVRDGHVQAAVHGEPAFESFFPYLPLMTAFGLPNIGKGPVKLTDTRVLFSIVTLIVVGVALLLLDVARDRKMRALQFLTVLPTAALPLAGWGDDVAVVAFLLLAMVLAQRRRPGWSGIVLGVVSAMKFTAWPLAALALFCARDRTGRRAPGRMLLGTVAVAGPIIAPFALSEARAFYDNAILFPLGLSGVPSPAASNLPGHIIVTELPWLHTALPVIVAVVGGIVLLTRLWRHPPSTPAQVCMLAGWIMLVAIVFAPATRVGYLLYPVDFFVWGAVLFREDRGADRAADRAAPATQGAGVEATRSAGVTALLAPDQVASGIS